jgi:hypothetical protein
MKNKLLLRTLAVLMLVVGLLSGCSSMGKLNDWTLREGNLSLMDLLRIGTDSVAAAEIIKDDVRRTQAANRSAKAVKNVTVSK